MDHEACATSNTDCQGTGQESSIRSVHVSHSSARKSLAILARANLNTVRLEADVARRLNRQKKRLPIIVVATEGKTLLSTALAQGDGARVAS